METLWEGFALYLKLCFLNTRRRVKSISGCFFGFDMSSGQG